MRRHTFLLFSVISFLVSVHSIDLYHCDPICWKISTHPQYIVLQPGIRNLNQTNLENEERILYLVAGEGNLSTIEPGTLQHFRNLKKVYINVNPIKYINYGVFNNLNLEYLDLALNEILDIETEAFSELNHLQYLYLHGNKLTTFDFSWFTTNNVQSPLRAIYLHTNKIKTVQSNAFAFFPNLSHIYLHINQITYIEDQAFNGNLNLEIVDLSFNQLTTISPDIFKNVPVVKQFLISFNNISYINKELFEKNYIQSVNLHPNMWLCSCYEEFVQENVNTTILKNYKYSYIKGDHWTRKELNACYKDIRCNAFKQKETDFLNDVNFINFTQTTADLYSGILSSGGCWIPCMVQEDCPMNYICKSNYCWIKYFKFCIDSTQGTEYWG